MLFYVWKKIRNYILSQNKSIEVDPPGSNSGHPSSSDHAIETLPLLNRSDMVHGHFTQIPEMNHLEGASCSYHNDVRQGVKYEPKLSQF